MNRVVAGVALLALGVCGWSKAQVLDQVPSNALGVFEVKDLQGVSTKVAALAKKLGIDQMDPRWGDPLGSVMTEMHLKKGIRKDGDLAIAFFNPHKEGAPAKENADANEAKSDQPPLVVLIPVDDYKAFLSTGDGGNFEEVKDVGDGISQVTVPANKEKLFVVQRGKYAVSSMDKALLANHDGIKLHGPAEKEAQTKDAIIYFDVKSVRPQLQKAYENVRAEAKKQLEGQNNPVGMQVPPFVFALYDKAAQQFLSDTRSATISFNLNDAGLGSAFIGDFEPDSYLGKLVAESNKTDSPMLAGLPDRALLMYGGAIITPQVWDRVITDVMDTIKQSEGDKAKGQDVNKWLEAWRKALKGMKSTTFAMLAPDTGENLMQVVGVTHGDAKQILESTKQGLSYANTFLGNMGGKNKMTLALADPTTTDGVQVQPYNIKFDFDPNDPMAAQQKQIMAMMYGPNGVSGYLAVVNDNTLLQAQGVSDKVLSEAIAAAKGGTDTLSKSDALKITSEQLPKPRGAEFYIAMDEIANTAVKFMKQQGMAIQFKLPPNLPPVGMAVAKESSAVRVDTFIPTKLVEAMTSAVMQTMMQMNGGGKGV
jgi:hypothetical protein